MATKTISITEEAYERLKMHKEKNESFTDVINRVTGKKRSILELAEIFSKEDAEKIEMSIKKSRAQSTAHMKEFLEKWNDTGH